MSIILASCETGDCFLPAKHLRIISPECGQEYPLDTRNWRCLRCGGHLQIAGAPEFDPARIDGRTASLWRYRAFFPLPDGAEPVTIGEGWTPIIPIEWNGRNIHCKLDFLMPTGSFKDRGSTLLVSALKALGIDNLVEDSSGNAAASLAAYSARAGLNAIIFAPAHASPAKLKQIRAYAPRLTPVAGSRENSATAAQSAAAEGAAYYASHCYNPFSLFGMCTTAWEIWEQLGFRAPDAVVAPIGHGTNLVGLYRGFATLRDRRLIQQLPRFIAVQSANIAPVVKAFMEEKTEAEPFATDFTIAEGIAIRRPAHGAEILRIVRETDGAAVAVTEDEIRAACEKLARGGILVEPTSAVSMAALDKISNLTGATVVTLTGSGLKTL